MEEKKRASAWYSSRIWICHPPILITSNIYPYGWEAIRILAVALDFVCISAVRSVMPKMSSW